MTPEQPAHDLVYRPDGAPVTLEAPTHEYRGRIRAHFLDRYVEQHGQTSELGLIDDGDDSRRNLGVELLTQLWECLEMVLPGDLVPPQKDHHADSTDLVFSHDACGGPVVSNDRWGGAFHPKKFFVVFASHPREDDPFLVVCRDGQARRRKGLRELRTIVKEHLAEHPDDHRIAYTCCDPPEHPSMLATE